MFKKLLLSAAFVLSMSAAAEARTTIIYQEAPVYYQPAPVYYQPAPVYYDPFFPFFRVNYYEPRHRGWHDRGYEHREAPRHEGRGGPHDGPHGRW